MGSVSLQEDTEKPRFPPQLEKGTQKSAVMSASRRKRTETHQSLEKVVGLTFPLVTTLLLSWGPDPPPAGSHMGSTRSLMGRHAESGAILKLRTHRQTPGAGTEGPRPDVQFAP